MASELRFLVVSDIHSVFSKLKQLVANVEEASGGIVFDFVLCLGDLSNWDWQDETIDASLEECREILQTLRQFGKPLIYLPGNHDPTVLFHGHTFDKISDVINLHKSSTLLAENLMAVGVGGSIDAYQNGEVIWPGTPYRGEEGDASLEKDVIDLLDKVPNDCSVLLLTHTGPGKLGTAVYNKDPANPIYAGSDRLEGLIDLNENQQRICVNLHGHTHYGFGMVSSGIVPVLNPGPLRMGCFGLLTIRTNDKKWEVGQWDWRRLPHEKVEVVI